MVQLWVFSSFLACFSWQESHWDYKLQVWDGGGYNSIYEGNNRNTSLRRVRVLTSSRRNKTDSISWANKSHSISLGESVCVAKHDGIDPLTKWDDNLGVYKLNMLSSFLDINALVLSFYGVVSKNYSGEILVLQFRLGLLRI